MYSLHKKHEKKKEILRGGSVTDAETGECVAVCLRDQECLCLYTLNKCVCVCARTRVSERVCLIVHEI